MTTEETTNGTAKHKTNSKTAPEATSNKRAVLTLPKLEERELTLVCLGVDTLVMNAMLNKGDPVPQQGGKPSDEAMFNRARYVIEGHDCFKAMTMKKAIVSAWPFVGKGNAFAGIVKKTLYVHGDVRDSKGTAFIIIDGQPELFPSEIRTDDGKSVMTVRPRYFPWAFKLRVTYPPRYITDQQVLQLVQAAGVYCGLGENRPSKTGGTWGRFQVDATKPIVARSVVGE